MAAADQPRKGHDFQSPIKRKVLGTGLQCGRGRSAAESKKLQAAHVAAARFNVAAADQPRKVSCGRRTLSALR